MKRFALTAAAAMAFAAIGGSTGLAEMPADLSPLLKARLYSEAVKLAKEKQLGDETVLALEALAEAKRWVVAGASSGRQLQITVEMMGQKLRGKLVSADEELYTANVMGAEQKFNWSQTPDERFYYVVRRYMDETDGPAHLQLARACVFLGLGAQAEEELQEASKCDVKLAKEIAAVRALMTGASAAGGSGVATPAPASPGSEAPAQDPARTSSPSEPSRVAGEVERSIPKNPLSSITGGLDPVTVTAGAIRFTVTKDSDGFVSDLSWNGREVAKAGGARRSFCDALRPAATTDGAGNAGEAAESKCVVTAISGGSSSAAVAGVYRSAAGESKFVTRISASGDSLRVEHSVEIGFDPRQWRVAALGVTLPFNLEGSKFQQITTVPGQSRTDWWKLDQNDDRQPNWLTSDTRSRWPLWRIGGLLVDSSLHYRTWKSNMRNTWPLTTDEGAQCPCTLDLQDSAKGVTVTIARMREEAPKEITSEMATGSVTAYFWSPRVAPLNLLGTGTGDKSLAERCGIYPGSAKTHVAVFTFHQGGQDPKSFRPLGR